MKYVPKLMLGGYTSPTTVPSPRCGAGPGQGAGSADPLLKPRPSGSSGCSESINTHTGAEENQDLRPRSLPTKLGRNLPGGLELTFS